MKSKVLIVGPGAVGKYIGLYLSQLEIEVGFYSKSGLTEVSFYEKKDNTRTYWQFDQKKEVFINECDFIIFATKAYDLISAIEKILPRCKQDSILIPICNGYYLDDLFKVLTHKNQRNIWRTGICNFGITQINNEIKLNSSKGFFEIGPLTEANFYSPIRNIERQILDIQGIDFIRWHDNIAYIQQRKWLYNSVVNTLCAVNQFPKNIDLLKELGLLQSIFKQVFHFYCQKWNHLSQNEEIYYNQLLEFIKLHGENENSMARDVRLGRKTEFEYLTGIIPPSRYPLIDHLNQQIRKLQP